MQHSSELKGFTQRPMAAETSRELLLDIIRQTIHDHPLRDRAIFELSYYTSISNQELINLNISDVDVDMRTVRLKGGDETLYITIPSKCATLLQEICSDAFERDSPLFLNNSGERLSFSNLWFIKRNFSIQIGPYP